MSGPDPCDAEEFRSSTPHSSGPGRAAGEMGVSSERVGHAGPGQEATDGVRDVAPHERDPAEEVPPEQSPGNPEDNPEGLRPKAGYPSKDPRSDKVRPAVSGRRARRGAARARRGSACRG